MRNLWKWGILTVWLVSPVLASAQTLSAAGNGLQSMNLPEGAKATALGGAFSSWADDTSAVYWNPAGMAWLPKIQIQTAYNQWFQDTFFQDLGLAWPMDWGAVGARLSYINLGSITARDTFGYPTGTLIPEDWGGSFAVAGRAGDFAVGLATKAYFELLSSYTYGGWGIDAGALFRSGRFDLSLGARNIGLVSDYGFPTEYYAGTSLGLGPDNFLFRLATDATDTAGGVIFHHGLELGYQKTVFLRVGYQWFPQPVPDQQQVGLSGGVGIALADFQLDYSLVSYGDFGSTNQVSLSYQFSVPKVVPTETMKSIENSNSRDEGDDATDESETDTQTISKTLEKPTIVATAVPTPSSTEAFPELPSLSLKSSYKVGIETYKARNYELAAKWLKKVSAMPASAGESVYVSEADAMLGIIYEYYLKTPDRLNQARHYYRAALKIDPANSTAKKHLGELEAAEPGDP